VQSELQRVLELQPFHDSLPTAAMVERGTLVREAIPAWLGEHAAALDAAVDVDDFFIEGSNGKGRSAFVPWTRFGSRLRAPKATEGFYVVYLFDAAGKNVYLSLNQGTTDPGPHAFVSKPVEWILEQIHWARSVLGPWLEDLDDPTAPIHLNATGLGTDYEGGNIAAISYELGAIPDDATLFADAKKFAEALGVIYREHDERPLPKEQPEVREAEEAADQSVGRPRKSSGAGFRTNAADIKVIEKHAVKLATTYYKSQGFKVKELGKPFDLEVKKGDLTLAVEVKGTTSDGSKVVLTRNEVAHHEGAHPENALVIVRNIKLHRGRSPKADGGHLYELRGWEINPDALRPISYTYEVPGEIFDHAGVTGTNLS
jgi:hypothetical protein